MSKYKFNLLQSHENPRKYIPKRRVGTKGKGGKHDSPLDDQKMKEMRKMQQDMSVMIKELNELKMKVNENIQGANN